MKKIESINFNAFQKDKSERKLLSLGAMEKVDLAFACLTSDCIDQTILIIMLSCATAFRERERERCLE